MDSVGQPSTQDQSGARWLDLCRRIDTYRLLFESMDEGYCVIEFLDGPHGPLSDYIHVAANAAYAAHAGIENVVGQRLREMVPEEADAWVARYGEVLRTGQPMRFQQELIATGRYLDISAHRLGTLEDRLVAVLFKDATQRRRAEDELVRLNRELEAGFAEALAERAVLAEIVEKADAIVQVIDTDMRLLAINGAALQGFRDVYGLELGVGHRQVDFMTGSPEKVAEVTQTWGRALAGESFVKLIEIDHPAKGPLYFEARFNPLHGPHGDILGAYQFVYDVTDRHLAETRLADAEDALRHSAKLEAVGQLTGGLAHDFNNMLGGISGALELIRERLAQGRSDEIERYVEAALGATERAASLTHRLLAFSRRQTLSPRSLDICTLVEGLIELCRRSVGPSIVVTADCAAGLWNAHADANQLENALLNLCLNSRDAMPEGGAITIRATNRTLAPGQGESAPAAGEYVELSVSDTGTGIDRATIDRVFEPFFTTKLLGQGTGLGLSMVYGFVTQSAGHVEIDSQPGQGTTVRLLLPRDHSDIEGVSTAPPSLSDRTTPARILVVDDEVLIRMTVVDELTDHGYECLEAGDGQTALDLLASNPDITLLLTDVGLPGGLNGRQVADAARAAKPDLAVLFITGYAENAALNAEHIGKATAVLIKPFAMARMLEQVSALLAIKPAGG